MHEIERNRSQKLGCQANGGARAGRAPPRSANELILSQGKVSRLDFILSSFQIMQATLCSNNNIIIITTGKMMQKKLLVRTELVESGPV